VDATRPPDARRARHEARGEWPQPSLWQLLEERVRRTPARAFIIEGRREGGHTWTFADVAARAEHMAGALERVGVKRGDVIAWQLPNWWEAAALAAAIDRLGAVSNPMLTIYREREVGFACRQARARVLVVPGVVRGVDHREIARAVQKDAPELAHVLTVRAEPGAGQQALETLETAARSAPTPPGPHDVSMLFYTSGTTADPKGVLHTPSTLGAILHFHAILHAPGPEDRSLLQFPLTHIGGIVLYVMLPMAHGSSTVFMENFEPTLAVDLIETHGVTAAGGPPAILQAIFAAPNFSPEKMRSVRASGSGAADVSPELVREMRAKLGAFAYRSYGMTECPIITSGARNDPDDALTGTDGRAVPGCEIRVVDEHGRVVPPNVEGDLEAYGPQLCVGYLDAALNAAFTADGFIRTGDLAVMDAGGYVRITGRRKDIIIRKGENLSAKGIEDELSAHLAVADVAVIGVPDAASGERVCACVVLRGDATLTLDDVRRFMEGRGVMRQKIPEQLEVLAELPRNATGKVRKDVLRSRFR
jgi:cyclohexanecarboxylate-CoA ligase